MSEKLNRNPIVERLSSPLLLAEIGTGGLDVGYDVRTIPEGSTVVTVDLLRGVGASAGHHSVSKIPGLYSTRKERYEASEHVVADFKHVPVFADGREAPFKDGTFDYTLLSSVISDPGIPNESAATLVTEALRITKDDGVVILRDDLTPGITADRLAMSNSKSADIVRLISSADPDYENIIRGRVALHLTSTPEYFGPEVRFLSKGEGYGETPLAMYDVMQWRAMQTRDAMEKRRQEKREKRQALLARFGLAKRG